MTLDYAKLRVRYHLVDPDVLALLDEIEQSKSALSVRDQEVAWLDKRVEQLEEGRRVVMRDTASDRKWLRDNPTVTSVNVNTYTLALDLVEKQAEQLNAAKLRLDDMANAAAMLDSLQEQLATVTRERDQARADAIAAAMTAARDNPTTVLALLDEIEHWRNEYQNSRRRTSINSVTRERDEARAEVERLRKDGCELASMLERISLALNEAGYPSTPRGVEDRAVAVIRLWGELRKIGGEK